MKSRTACWIVGLAVAIIGWVMSTSRLIDKVAQERVKDAAAQLGVELTAESTSYALVNPPNDDGYYGPDIVLHGVTLRLRGASLHAADMSISLKPTPELGLDRRRKIQIGLSHASLEVDGSAEEVVSMARSLEDRVNAAQPAMALSVDIRDGSATLRGLAGSGSQAKVRVSYFFHSFGERDSSAEGEVTWSTPTGSEGPHGLLLDPPAYTRDGNAHELRLACRTMVFVRWADRIPAKVSAPATADCPRTIDLLGTLSK